MHGGHTCHMGMMGKAAAAAAGFTRHQGMVRRPNPMGGCAFLAVINVATLQTWSLVSCYKQDQGTPASSLHGH